MRLCGASGSASSTRVLESSPKDGPPSTLHEIVQYKLWYEHHSHQDLPYDLTAATAIVRDWQDEADLVEVRHKSIKDLVSS